MSRLLDIVRRRLQEEAASSPKVAAEGRAAPPRRPARPPAPPAPRGRGGEISSAPGVARQLLRRHDGRSDDGALVALDLFAGAGGFTLGAERQGVSVVGVERDPFAVKTSRGAGHTVAEMDVGELAGARVPVDLMIGGPPCQPFSSAGSRRGAYDPREGFKLLTPAVEASRPRRLVAENVSAFLHPQHRGFREAVLRGLRAHFKHVGVWVLNAKDFGVPQDRERVFVWAAERHIDPPRPTHGPGTRRRYVSVRQVLPHLQRDGYDAIMPFQTTARARSTDQPGFTLTTRRNAYAVIGTHWRYSGAGSVPKGKRRILQPEETLVIQAFPEGFAFVGSKDKQQCQIGNAVPPPLAAAVVSAMKVGLKPRDLTPTELLNAFGSIDESIFVLQPRPWADEALVGVLVDPAYLGRSGIITVYDGDKLYDQIWEYARDIVRLQAQDGSSSVDLADEQAVQVQAQQYAFGWMGSGKASAHEITAPRVIPMRLLRAAGFSRRKAYETIAESPEAWWTLLVVASLYVGWRGLWRESRPFHRDAQRLEAFLESRNLEGAEVLQDALSETASYLGCIAPLEAWQQHQAQNPNHRTRHA